MTSASPHSRRSTSRRTTSALKRPPLQPAATISKRETSLSRTDSKSTTAAADLPRQARVGLGVQRRRGDRRLWPGGQERASPDKVLVHAPNWHGRVPTGWRTSAGPEKVCLSARMGRAA